MGQNQIRQSPLLKVYPFPFNLGLWGIVNNAGFNVMGDVEWLTVNLYQKVMNVNFYGAIRTIRNFLYLVRKSKGIVSVSFFSVFISCMIAEVHKNVRIYHGCSMRTDRKSAPVDRCLAS